MTERGSGSSADVAVDILDYGRPHATRSSSVALTFWSACLSVRDEKD